MPIIDEAHSKSDADSLVRYWSSQIRRYKLQSVAGVKKVKSKVRGGGDEWDIVLELHVPRDSKAYKELQERFGF